MVRTRLRPEHFGEPMVSALLQKIADGGELNTLRAFSSQNRTSIQFGDVLTNLGIGHRLQCHDNVRLASVSCGQTVVTFDGLSRIDCLLDDGSNGVPLEIKLGTSRMATAEFANRFFSSCDWSDHVPPRVKGNMIAVLDGRFIQTELVQATLSGELGDGRKVPLRTTWLLLIRREVWEQKWKTVPSFNRPCYILIFEDLVSAAGGPAAFDEIIRELVGNEFAVAWGLS